MHRSLTAGALIIAATSAYAQVKGLAKETPIGSSQTGSNPPAEKSEVIVHLTGRSYNEGLRAIVTDVGAGENGPAKAQVGATIRVTKDNWNSVSTIDPAITGENDGVYVKVFQGGKNSDSSGYLAQMTGTGDGFINGAEYSLSQIPAGTNRIANGIDIQMGIINQGKEIYGFNANLREKESKGVLSTAYSANTESNNKWDKFLSFFSGGKLEYVMDGNGNSFQNGALRSGVYSVRSLPSKCEPGQLLYANDGRKLGETPGNGSGIAVICTPLTKGGISIWAAIPVAPVLD